MFQKGEDSFRILKNVADNDFIHSKGIQKKRQTYKWIALL